MRPDAAAAIDLRDLTHGEHLVVWSFRAFAVGRWKCRLVERTYRSACGALAASAQFAVEIFAQELQIHGRRAVLLAPPGVTTLTRDEQLLLAIYASAQHQDEPRCEAHLCWLLGRPPPEVFRSAAGATATALAANGHWLRLPAAAAQHPSPNRTSALQERAS